MLRADVCNSVDELGQLLDHTGPVAASERNAARIFGAEHLFFVTNGTSTSNKIVWHYVVAPGDVVIVDRNCHKSVLHAITMTGAIPVFLTPTRNHYGIIGAIPLEEFGWESIEAKIRSHPLIGAEWKKKGKPRILTLTQSTYDGIVYNVETIKAQLDGRVDTLHFDEAWLPHAAFHVPVLCGVRGLLHRGTAARRGTQPESGTAGLRSLRHAQRQPHSARLDRGFASPAALGEGRRATLSAH